ncbi:MAG: hypothetical protein ACR2GX_01155 [Candidatus Dormibacteria bacterium]
MAAVPLFLAFCACSVVAAAAAIGGPHLTVTTTVNGQHITTATAGDVLHYTVTVVNDGSVDLTTDFSDVLKSNNLDILTNVTPADVIRCDSKAGCVTAPPCSPPGSCPPSVTWNAGSRTVAYRTTVAAGASVAIAFDATIPTTGIPGDPSGCFTDEGIALGSATSPLGSGGTSLGRSTAVACLRAEPPPHPSPSDVKPVDGSTNSAVPGILAGVLAAAMVAGVFLGVRAWGGRRTDDPAPSRSSVPSVAGEHGPDWGRLAQKAEPRPVDELVAPVWLQPERQVGGGDGGGVVGAAPITPSGAGPQPVHGDDRQLSEWRPDSGGPVPYRAEEPIGDVSQTIAQQRSLARELAQLDHLDERVQASRRQYLRSRQQAQFDIAGRPELHQLQTGEISPRPQISPPYPLPPSAGPVVVVPAPDASTPPPAPAAPPSAPLPTVVEERAAPPSPNAELGPSAEPPSPSASPSSPVRWVPVGVSRGDGPTSRGRDEQSEPPRAGSPPVWLVLDETGAPRRVPPNGGPAPWTFSDDPSSSTPPHLQIIPLPGGVVSPTLNPPGPPAPIVPAPIVPAPGTPVAPANSSSPASPAAPPQRGSPPTPIAPPGIPLSGNRVAVPSPGAPTPAVSGPATRTVEESRRTVVADPEAKPKPPTPTRDGRVHDPALERDKPVPKQAGKDAVTKGGGATSLVDLDGGRQGAQQRTVQRVKRNTEERQARRQRKRNDSNSPDVGLE